MSRARLGEGKAGAVEQGRSGRLWGMNFILKAVVAIGAGSGAGMMLATERWW